MTEFRRVALETGVTLNVEVSGDAGAPAVILLHGFPESHRTWREIEPRLSDRFRLIMPDQRGYAGSDKPREVKAYKSDKLVDDIFALADALGLERFALVGHDWGGAIAWSAALRGDPRLSRLAIINAPHPVIFQKSLIADSKQRAASQYITAFRTPGFAKLVEWKGFDWFFDQVFGGHVDVALIPEAEKQQYIAEWSQPGAFAAMLNWYRASPVKVPLPGITLPLPDWLLKPFAKVEVPTLVIWGMRPGAAAGAARRAGPARHGADGDSHRGRRALRPLGGARCGRRGACPLPCRGARGYSPAAMTTAARSRTRSAARLASVQALYQQEMEGIPLPRLLKEFHDHRLGATIEDAEYVEAERDFFDDIVSGVDARRADIDKAIAAKLASGWSLERLDRPMRAILRAGAYELIARPDVPIGSVISEYVDVAHAFYDKRESGFVNGLLDAIAKEVRR